MLLHVLSVQHFTVFYWPVSNQIEVFSRSTYFMLQANVHARHSLLFPTTTHRIGTVPIHAIMTQLG